MHRYLVPIAVAAVVVAVGVVGLAVALVQPGDDANARAAAAEVPTEEEVAAVAAELGPVEVLRSESCGCCGGHVEHLGEAGFEVEEQVFASEDAVPAVKRDLGIPEELWSCHTTMVDGYAVEGHVPADVIATLHAQEWEVDGVALPGMPAGSPGMAGTKAETWTFPTFAQGEVTEVLTQR